MFVKSLLRNSLCFGFSVSALILLKPVDQRRSTAVQTVPDLLKRAIDYPYGPSLLNEFGWDGWNPNSPAQRANAAKIHGSWKDMINMVALAWREADHMSDTFKRWFDGSSAQDVKNVLERLFNSANVPRPTPLMKDWICEGQDIKNHCEGTRRAYTWPKKGVFHICPNGLAKPMIRDIKCADLDPFASPKMISIAFTMLHESTHWIKIGDAALGGKHIKDIRSSAIACSLLTTEEKLLNAQNYAFLGAEAYFKSNGCTFTDPPRTLIPSVSPGLPFPAVP